MTVNIPAYAQDCYQNMSVSNQNMLVQSCGSVTYHFPGTTTEAVLKGNNLSAFANRVVAASATTWTKDNGTWLPYANYVWNVPMNSSGLPVTPYIPFNYSTPSARDASWKYTGSIEKYDNFSTPLETKNGKGISSSVIYRNDFHLPIGTIANSKFDECATFTCDYDIDVNSLWFDEPNGWKHYNNQTKPTGAVCELASATPPHFGEKCLHVINCQAAAKTIAVHSPTAKITWSAWVRPIDDKPIRFAACLVENGTGNSAVYYDYEYNKSNGLIADGVTWQFVKFTIDISKPVSGTLPASFDGVATENGIDGIYVWVGNHPGDPVSDFYIEDIRIYPAKALVTTTYYDSKWQQPILTVDANGNPSQKVEYDDFGRPVRWNKIDKKTGNLTLLQQKEYHLMVDFYSPEPDKWYKIVPEANENFCIDIKDAEWRNNKEIHLWPYNGTLNQLWKFVPRGDGYYNIVSKGGAGIDFGIDDPNGRYGDEQPLMIYTVSDNNQKWEITNAGDGFCRIAAHANGGAYIGLAGGSATDNGKIQIWNHDEYTRWKLVEVTDEVRIKNTTMDFYIGKMEVTQAEYQTLMGGKNPSFATGMKHPVEQVTWYDALLYCNAKSIAEGLEPVYGYTSTQYSGENCTSISGLTMDITKTGYRLPKEDEWSAAYYYNTAYAPAYFWGTSTDFDDVAKYAWYYPNGSVSTHEVALRAPSPAGLYDIAGNVWELVWYTGSDGTDARIYGGSSKTDANELTGESFKPVTSRSSTSNSVGFRIIRKYSE